MPFIYLSLFLGIIWNHILYSSSVIMHQYCLSPLERSRALQVSPFHDESLCCSEIMSLLMLRIMCQDQQRCFPGKYFQAVCCPAEHIALWTWRSSSKEHTSCVRSSPSEHWHTHTDWSEWVNTCSDRRETGSRWLVWGLSASGSLHPHRPDGLYYQLC